MSDLSLPPQHRHYTWPRADTLATIITGRSEQKLWKFLSQKGRYVYRLSQEPSSGLSQGWDAGQGAAGEKGQEVGSRYKTVGDVASSLSQGDGDPSQATVSFL